MASEPTSLCVLANSELFLVKIPGAPGNGGPHVGSPELRHDVTNILLKHCITNIQRPFIPHISVSGSIAKYFGCVEHRTPGLGPSNGGFDVR
jgi:hypothetical protein